MTLEENAASIQKLPNRIKVAEVKSSKFADDGKAFDAGYWLGVAHGFRIAELEKANLL